MQTFKTDKDIEAWGFTFGQRIGLGIIYNSQLSDIKKFQKIFHCLENRKPKFEEVTSWKEYLSIVDIVVYYWMLKETLLKYEPTPDELKSLENIDNSIYDKDDPAGNTIRTLARIYNADPADVLNWEYSKVFRILFDDLEKSNHERLKSSCN